MDFTPVKTPKIVAKTLSGLTWNFADDKNSIYLTFDDGPTPEITDWVLDTLKEYNAKATFFCIGKNVKENAVLYDRIREEGHAVGNHTFNHLNGWKTKTKEYIQNIEEARPFINSTLFRPPYGKLKPKQLKYLDQTGFSTIMWSVLSKDWEATLQPEKCASTVIEKTGAGDIIVFHDSIKASNNMMYALPKVLSHFSKKGFEFKRIPE